MLKNIVNINQHGMLFKGYFYNSIVALLSLVLENGHFLTGQNFVDQGQTNN
jgi:hypothetical protein